MCTRGLLAIALFKRFLVGARVWRHRLLAVFRGRLLLLGLVTGFGVPCAVDRRSFRGRFRGRGRGRGGGRRGFRVCRHSWLWRGSSTRLGIARHLGCRWFPVNADWNRRSAIHLAIHLAIYSAIHLAIRACGRKACSTERLGWILRFLNGWILRFLNDWGLRFLNGLILRFLNGCNLRFLRASF